MNIIEPVRMGMDQLRVHKMRSFLSILGILISVGSVTGIMSMGDGLRVTITNQFVQSGGTNAINIQPPERNYRNESGNYVRREWEEFLNTRDVDYFQEIENIEYIVPILQTSAPVEYKGISVNATVRASNELYLKTQNWKIAKGRFINAGDVSSAAKVAVLEADLATDLFGEMDPIGKEIRIQGIRVQVIGVLAPVSGIGNANARDMVGPITTVQRRFTGDTRVNSILVGATSPEEVDRVASNIRVILKRYHNHGNEFRIQTGQDAIAQFNRIVFILNAIAGGIAGISLLVGGIGIMNIMLVSVNERTREIGIRKAIGAKNSSILFQFILEAIVLCLFGGILGILLGLSIGAVISSVIQNLTGQPFVSIVTPGMMFFALLYSSLIGLFFGVFPAWRASRLNPIEALRYE